VAFFLTGNKETMAAAVKQFATGTAADKST
jgi:hypothetical protein